jgi:hypothetical protein
MNDISTDRGSILEPDACALVASADGSLSFLMPQVRDEEAVLPRKVLLLVAVLVRAEDDEWVDEMLEFLEQERSV